MRTFRQFYEAQWAEPSLNNHFNLQTQLDHLEENPNLNNLQDFLISWTRPFVAVQKEVKDLIKEFYNMMQQRAVPSWDHNYDHQSLANLSTQLYHFVDESSIRSTIPKIYGMTFSQHMGVPVNSQAIINQMIADAKDFNEFIDRFLMPERDHNMFEHLIQTLTALEKYINETIPLLQRAKEISKRIH